MKKIFCVIVFTVFSLSIFAELPKIESNAESVVYAFQSLVDAVYDMGCTLNVDYRNKELELETLSGQLGLDYETVRRYVENIEQEMKKIERSGMLSKTELADFKNSMENSFSIQQKSLDHCKLPESMQPVYDNPNISILEENAKIYASNIELAQQYLNEMQTPAQIQEIITKEHEELEQLKAAKKKNTKQIKNLENHSLQLGVAYGRALNTEQEYKQAIIDNTERLNAVPAQIQKYKDAIDAEYKTAFMKKISNINIWIDFFDGKNTEIYNFLQMLDTKNMMQKKIDDVVPVKDSRIYQKKLDSLIESWKL